MAQGKKTGGRVKGVPNKASTARAAEIAASGLTPLAFMLAYMRNEANPMDARLDAASKAAPYVHPRLAAIEHSGNLHVTSHEEMLDQLDGHATGPEPRVTH